MVNNLTQEAFGMVSPPILSTSTLGTPYLDGNVVRVDSSVAFKSWGSCAASVAFQMQSRVCGGLFDSCTWVTRNHGNPEFFWAHDDTGEVSQQVTMGCRKGTNSYRVHMQVIGLQSVGEKNDKEGALGVEPSENVDEDGPVVKLKC